jgi:hypothetical protein
MTAKGPFLQWWRWWWLSIFHLILYMAIANHIRETAGTYCGGDSCLVFCVVNLWCVAAHNSFWEIRRKYCSYFQERLQYD